MILLEILKRLLIWPHITNNGVSVMPSTSSMTATLAFN